MTSDRELTHIVRSWMQEGVNVFPDRVLNDVLNKLPVTPQRRPWWRAWRTRLMNSTMKFAAVGTLGLAIGVVALAVYFSRPALTPGGSPTPHPSPAARTQAAVAPATSAPASATPSPSVSPTSSPAIPSASLLPNRRMPGTHYSPAGEYGWQGSPGGAERAGMHWFEGQGPNARELADMVFSVGPLCDAVPIAGLDSSIPVRVAGYNALYVEPYEPAVSYNSPDGDETTRAYKVDVDGRSLCVYVTWHATTTDRQLESLLDVIDSFRAQPVGETGIRITFTLDEGWDIG